MYPFIVCFCGRALGDIYDLFCAMRSAKQARMFEGIDIDPSYVPIVDTIQIDLLDVFDSLGLHMDCCRTRMLTQVEFKTIY